MTIAASNQNSEKMINISSVEKLQAVLKRYCMSLTKSYWDAEELAQDTWVKALRNLNGSEHGNTEALLLRIAKNTWIDYVRRQGVLKRILNGEQAKVTMPDNGSFEIEIALQSLMNHLSPLQRTVFLLRDVFGYSISETSEVLKTTEGAIKVALHRARKSLESVQEDLQKDEISMPEQESAKTWLRAVTAAYQMGDIATLVMLVYRNEVAPEVAIGIVNSKLHHIKPPVKVTSSQTINMLAA